MISNKTAATFFLVVLVVVPAVFASVTPKSGLLDKIITGVKKFMPRSRAKKATTPSLTTDNSVELVNTQGKNLEFHDDTQKASPPNKPTLKTRPGRKYGTNESISVLRDTTDEVMDVLPARDVVMSTSQEQSAPQVNNQFKTLIEQGEYEKIFEIGKEMNDEEFMKQLCPVIETLDQYNGVVGHLERRKMVASFYVFGNIGVVKGTMIKSRVYDYEDYVNEGDLETALPLALEKDRHYRVMELLDVRKEISAKVDERLKREGEITGFGWFVHWFLDSLAPSKDGTVLGRFFNLRGGEFRNEYPDILDTLCQCSVSHLSDNLDSPKSEGLLVDLIGQPSLLTPVVFATGFLDYCDDKIRSAFIKHGYREAIQEGLKTKYRGGGKKLWWAMQRGEPDQFRGQFPETEEALAAVLKHFPAKQQKEEEWADKNDEIFYNELKRHKSISHLFPDVLWPIIFGYVTLRSGIDDPIILK